MLIQKKRLKLQIHYIKKNGDIDSALEYLNGKGLSQKQIENHYSSMEMDRINKIYEETGDIKAAFK